MGPMRLEGLLLCLLLAAAGPVQAQVRPANEAPGRNYARLLEKQLKEVEQHDCTSRGLVRIFLSWFVFVILGAVVVTAAIVMKGAGWLYLRASTTTDPEQLARSDPWVREYLARQSAARGDRAADEPGAAEPPRA